MKKFKRWMRNKLRKFLYIDDLESSLSEFNAYFQTSKSNLEYEIRKINKNISHFQDSVNVLHNTVENVVHIGTDIRHEGKGSWAVICIEGKMNIVKFVDLDRKDARDVMMFLKQFEAGRYCIDTPYKEMFYDGLFKF